MLFRFLTLCAVVVIVGAGCGGANGRNPVMPPGPEGLDVRPMQGAPVSSNRYLWGIWKIRVDSSGAAVVTPDRDSQMHLNVVKLLEVSPCADCLKVGNIMVTSPHDLSVDVTLKHPYKSNLNTTGFDVRGIFMTDADVDSDDYCYSFSFGTAYPKLLNADGYTEYFYPATHPSNPPLLRYYPGKYSNSSDLTAEENPFIAYGKDTPRRMFLPGTEETKTLNIRVPSWPFEFGYAVDACWADPGKKVTDPAVDFPPEANCNEAYMISVEVGEGLDEWAGSYAMVHVWAYDHQGWDTIKICIISAGFGDVWVDKSTVVGDDCVVFAAKVSNDKMAPAGVYPLEVAVQSQDWDPNLKNWHAWQISSIEVKPMMDHPPIAIASAYPRLRTVGEPIEFSSAGSYDPDGGPIKAYWDFDDGHGDQGSHVYYAYDSPGEYLVQCEVRDDEGNATFLDEPLKITVKSGVGWGRTWGADFGDDVATDKWGNVYVSGIYAWREYNSTNIGGDLNPDWENDFDPGPGQYWQPVWGSFCGFLSKFDSTGILLWARTWQASGYYYYPESVPWGIAIDDVGNIYVAGDAMGSTVDLDPGPGVDMHGTDFEEHYQDAWLVKLNPNGEYVWGRMWGGDGADTAMSVSIGPDGDVYVGGWFGMYADKVFETDFDPGPGVDMHPIPNTSGGRSCFVSKFTPSGDFVWARTWGSESESFVNGVATDQLSNVYATGTFSTECDFDPGPGEDILTSPGGSPFLTSLGPGGEYRFAQSWSEGKGRAVSCDDSGCIYVVGIVHEGDLDPGPGVDEQEAGCFLSKFNNAGEYIWGHTWVAGGTTQDSGANGVVAVDGGNVIVVGSTHGPVDYDPGPGVVMPPWQAPSAPRVFVSAFNSEGEFQWVDLAYSDESHQMIGCFGFGGAVGPKGDLYFCGEVENTVDFDPGPGQDLESNYTEHATPRAFLWKIGPDGSY